MTPELTSYLKHLAVTGGITAGISYLLTQQTRGSLLIGAISATGTYLADKFHVVSFV